MCMVIKQVVLLPFCMGIPGSDLGMLMSVEYFRINRKIFVNEYV